MVSDSTSKPEIVASTPGPKIYWTLSVNISSAWVLLLYWFNYMYLEVYKYIYQQTGYHSTGVVYEMCVVIIISVAMFKLN